RGECVAFASALARSLFHASLAHPARDAHFARYQCDQLWGGVGGGGAELFAEPTRARLGQVLDALEVVVRNLLRSAQPVAALPIATLMEFLARVVARSVFHTALARVLKCRACLDAGFLSEASLLYIQLLETLDQPKAAATGLNLKAHPSAVPTPPP